MLERPRIPDWIREFSYPGWTNVFQLVPTNDHLYATETLFGDWASRVLLLVKDACPAPAIPGASDWRHAQRELGDKQGWRTNERLHRRLIPDQSVPFVSPGGKSKTSSNGARMAGIWGPAHFKYTRK